MAEHQVHAAMAREPGGAGAWLPDRLRPAGSRLRLLTPRECRILAMLGTGLSNRQMSQLMEISEATVKQHVASIFVKLGVESRLQAGLVGLVARIEGELAPYETGTDQSRTDAPTYLP
jgi:DNA-binding NarL/FixJ family response regulator